MTHFLKSIGDKSQAEKIILRGTRYVPAYRKFIEANGGNILLDSVPQTDKTKYLMTNNYRELLSDDYEETFTIFASSGSSGKTFYWPQLKSNHINTLPRLSEFLETAFEVSKKKTLAIIGLALGSWIGGEHFSWALKSFAINSKFPFSVFSPGNHHDEIIKMIISANDFAEQFIIFLCPSAIAHLKLRAEFLGVELPLEKLKFVVLGEAFPERVRETVQKDAKVSGSINVMFSIYGSADTGTLGVESLPSIVLRKIFTREPEVAKELGFSPPIPHFFHYVATDAYLETINNELIITKWQGIPLFRYNLHDSARLISWKKTKNLVLSLSNSFSKDSLNLLEILKRSPDNLPDIISITGRADSTLILCGTNISEAMLDEAINAEELLPYLTGNYLAKIKYTGARQRLAMDLEFKAGQELSKENKDKVYRLLIQSLGRVQPEFMNDWQNFYKVWDKDPTRRIIEINYYKWPEMSRQISIKHRGIQR